MFKRTVLPRSISRLASLNLIGSWKFFLHFKKLQFDIGAGTSGYRTTQNNFF
jgi:hypothetical protein